MDFKGRKLQLLHLSISLALSDLHNQIATCPSVTEFERELEEIEELASELEELQEKIEAHSHFTYPTGELNDAHEETNDIPRC